MDARCREVLSSNQEFKPRFWIINCHLLDFIFVLLDYAFGIPRSVSLKSEIIYCQLERRSPRDN